MEDSLYILIPLSLVLVFAIGLILWWSVRSGQFDDLEGPAYRMLMDDDKPQDSAPGSAPQHAVEGEQDQKKGNGQEFQAGRDGP